VEVIAFGTGTPTEVSQVRWVRLSEDHDALANQWFLVTQTPEPIAFVGFETSPPDRIGAGGATDPSRTWAGFVTDDPRLVGAIAGYLQGVSDREAPPALDDPKVARSTILLVATDDGVDLAYAACRRAGLEVARREGAAVVLYDRSSESYLVDPYESGPWTSQNHGPAGKTLLDPNELVRLGRRYLADQVAEGRALGLQVGAWLARGTGPAAMADACERLQVQRAILPDKLARRRCEIASWAAPWPTSRPACRPRSPSSTMTVSSPTPDQTDLPGPRRRSAGRQRRTTGNTAQPRVRNAARAASSKEVSGNGISSRIRLSRATVGLRSPSIRGRAICALTGVTRCSQ
jgi:hypothetical protein